MNKKELYKVTITDEDGKVVLEVESDCIIAAISDPSKSKEGATAIHSVYMANCTGVTIVKAFRAIGTIRRNAVAKPPSLGIALAIECLGDLAKECGVDLSDSDADEAGKKLEE